jgi:hypothetical protein
LNPASGTKDDGFKYVKKQRIGEVGIDGACYPVIAALEHWQGRWYS